MNGGNRYATVLTYLADTEEGGETVFPNIPAPGGRNPDTFSECARYHLAVKPKKGTAVLFHSIKPTGEVGGYADKGAPVYACVRLLTVSVDRWASCTGREGVHL